MTTIDQRNQQVDNQYNAGRDINVYQHPLSLTEAQRKRYRSRMLDRVQTIWISGILEHALQGTAQLALGLREQQSAVINPWRLVLQELDQSEPLLSADTRIEQVYEHANGEVLILGEPGAGKTMLLLELTRILLERARQDETQPIPVVFNLSSWAAYRQTLSAWLVSELTTKYQVPNRLAAFWIETDQVLPLLDGLDEVAAPQRIACVESINTYRRAHGLLPTVVCCRQADYEMLPTSIRLQLHTAVVVQPLTPEQIETYLANGGEQLAALRQTLREDVDLQILARTPLMLNVLTIAYQGPLHEEFTITGSLETKQEQIFATYVQRMLARRRISTRFTPAKTIHWLSWLAWQMKRHDQTEFYIERMQPDWLPHGRRYPAAFSGFLAVGIGLIFVLLIGITWNEISLLFFGSAYGQLSKQVPLWLYTLSYGLVAGLIAGFIAFRHRKEIKPAESINWSWRGMYQGLKRSRIAKVLVIFGVLFGILDALCIGLIMEIESVFLHENIPWFDILAKEFLVLLATLSSVIPYLLLLGILAGWFSVALSKSSLIKPNQGIRNSARYSLLVGSLSGLIIGLTFTGAGFLLFPTFFVPLFNLAFKLAQQFTPQANPSMHVPNYQTFFNLFTEPLYFVIIGLFGVVWCGLIVGLAKGGFACIQHIILRLHLLRAGVLPWNYPRFLDYAAERILLRKVGGGYMFVHRLLLEYFASQVITAASALQQQNPPVSTSSPPAPQQQNPPVFTYSLREGISSLKRVDTPPATSGAPQSDTAHQEEKASPTTPSRKTGINKGKLFAILFAVVILLLALGCNASIFSVVRQSVQSAAAQIEAYDATVTAQTEANATAVALANASPIAYPPKNMSPVLNDPLQDNSQGNNWEIDDPRYGNCKFINRAYDINTNQSEWCLALNTDFTNFIYEIQMKIVKGDEGGIAFRIDPANEYEDRYEFVITRDGSYAVYAYTPGPSTSTIYITVLALGSSPAIHRGLNQTNLVAAVVHGKIIELYVNHQRVAVVSSSTSTHGLIGVIVTGSESNQTEIIFQNAKVWKL